MTDSAPERPRPTPLFELLGGEGPIRALVDRFYDLMDSLPEAEAIRDMHPDDLAESRDKLHMFLVGWAGGPQLYIEQHGHPALRRRHLPFEIDGSAAGAWMLCMRKALDEHVTDPSVRGQVDRALARIASHMRNVAG